MIAVWLRSPAGALRALCGACFAGPVDGWSVVLARLVLMDRVTEDQRPDRL
jgi:hypothetical protein